jgi:glutamyl-tRNA synthetase
MIRVRFAPSPTGYLHIGGVRTALFDFLYARNQDGKFLVRLEDTDRERSSPEFEKDILDSLSWLGLTSDESLIRQSERLDRYREIVRQLIAEDKAYEETVEGKTGVKFRMPRRKVVFHDLVHDAVEFDTMLFEDLVILKSDGYPTYHLACVVDDHDTAITHVIRGDDHISNTPRQILLFEALGWKPPKYAHLPLILGADGTPLSKRHGAVSLRNYKEAGFLPEALLNYLALLGWGAEGNQEFFTVQDLIKKFSLKRITKSNARFDRLKLEWLNAQHIKKLPEAEYIQRITAFFPEESSRFAPEVWRKIVLLYQTRIKTWRDLTSEAACCFSEVENYEEALLEPFKKNSLLKTYLTEWVGGVERLGDFNDFSRLEQLTREAAVRQKTEAKELIHPLRFALTGKTVSPGLFELMGALGKETCLKRVKKFLERLSL